MIKNNLISPKGMVGIVLYGIRYLGSENDADEFARLLYNAGEEYVPQKIGLAEPIKTDYSPEALREMWVNSSKNQIGGGVLLKGKNTKDFDGSIDWKFDESNIVALDISSKYLTSEAKVKNLIVLAKKLFIWSNCMYGYGVHSSQYRVHSTPGIDYKTCIGGISWMTLFGPPYVTMFGRDTLKTAPCIVEEFSDNCFMLLTSEEPAEPTPEILERQQRVKAHLGEDAFFRGMTQTTFTWEEIREGKNRPSKEGYRSPDFSEYLKDSGNPKSGVEVPSPKKLRAKDSPPIQDTMSALAEKAVEYAKTSFNVCLDFSEDSIGEVEKILAALYNSMRKQPDEGQLSNASVFWGAYIGEVFRRNLGGEWAVGDVMGEKDVITLKTTRGQIFPPNKVYKRLTNGPEDDINLYYQVSRAEFFS